MNSKKKDYILIDTGLRGNYAKEIMQAVIGQMSDGLWENSSTYEHYWRFVDVDERGGQIFLKVSTKKYDDNAIANTYYENYFYQKMNMDETKIKTFFAARIKDIIKSELKDELEDPVKGWNRESDFVSAYISYDEQVTVAHAYFAYETLKGRHNEKKYSPEIVKDML